MLEAFLPRPFPKSARKFKDNYQKHITEDELNGLDYEDYKKMEKRNFCQIMWSLFKNNYDFYSSFFMFHKEDYKIYSIKVMTYINTLLLSLVINISFYTDDTMHKIYIDNGDSIERLPIIFLTNAFSLIPSILFEIFFSSYPDYFIDLKTNMDYDDEEINKKAKKYYRGLIIRIIIFCIFSIPFDLFCWYYISCFFAVYLNTQKSIFIDFILEFLISIISCIFLSFLYTVIKCCFIKCCSSKIGNQKREKNKYCIMLVMNSFLCTNIIIIIIQYILTLIFS